MSLIPSNDRWRRPFFGPFTLAQVLAVIASGALAALTLSFVTTPLAAPASPGLPEPGATFYVIGSPGDAVRVGQEAPELELTSGDQTVPLTDLDGNPLRLADLRGRPVWISFWASWCPPCQEETPVLRDIYELYHPDGLELLAISVQDATADDVRAYVDRYDLRYTVAFDAGSKIFRAYGAWVLPTQILVDRSGIVRAVTLGRVTTGQAEDMARSLLELSPNPSPSVTSD